MHRLFLRIFLYSLLFFIDDAQIVAQSKNFSAFEAASAPEDEGFSSSQLSKVFPYVREHQVNIHSLMIIRNDKMVLDAYFYPFRKSLQHDIASCTKSIISLLIGIAIDKKYIPDEGQLVRTYFPEITTSSKNFETLTIKDLLTMTSGLACGFGNEDSLFTALFKTSDWPRFIFGIPSASEPGKEFSYCSCNYQLLAEILYRATKMLPEQFARKYLFSKLGIDRFYWSKNSEGINHGWGDLALTPHDMARIGRLLLNDGRWNGVQIISADYIKKATRIQIAFSNSGGYGYGFWIDNDHAFNAEGRGGQRIHVDRLFKLIIVATGGGYDLGGKGGLDELIGSSINLHPLARNQQAADSLKAEKARAANTVNSELTPGFSGSPVNHLFDRVMVFGKNSLDIARAEIQTTGHSDKVFKVTDGSGQVTSYPLGPQTRYRYFTDTSSNHVYALRGYWESQDDFVIDFNELTKINKYKIDLILKKGESQVSITEKTLAINETIPIRFEDN